jgi:hypothetical protein
MNPVRASRPKIRKIRPTSSASMKAVTAPPKPESNRPVPPELAVPVWHVWVEGGEEVGPVSADQIARGLRAGKIPSEASIRHENEPFWSDLFDNADVVAALKDVSIESEPPPPSALTPNLVVRRYYVWVDGCDPVGPVSADQIARGIRAGKVPTDASLQREGDFFAFDVLDEPEVIAALKQL